VITVVLDDDPTGTQLMSDVPVVLDWTDAAAWDAVREDDRAVHVLTNSRAHSGSEAAALVAEATRAARAWRPGARVVLRGDSTLRAHVWEEYAALRDALAPGRTGVPLLLVPALPSAGRFTVDGVQVIERDGVRIPLDRTEYASDGDLAYSSAALARWADERSRGRMRAADAVAIPSAVLRRPDGAAAVADALETAAQAGRPAAVVPDAETDADLKTIAAGLEAAEHAGTVAIVRCAPAFAAVLTRTRSRSTVAAPVAHDGVLVVCGSFVPESTAQLAELDRVRPGATIAASAAEFAGERSDAEIERVAAAARSRIASGGLAVVATERVRDRALVAPAAQRRVAIGLARAAAGVRAGVVISKGGITAAVTARDGLGARWARAIGPLLPGVALWKLPDDVDYLVVPGNVGPPALLADLVAAIQPHTPAVERSC
jgi:hypothetical protein